MSESHTIDDKKHILAALLRAKSKFGPILKTARGNFGKYPNLEGIFEAIDPALAGEGIFLTQTERNERLVTEAWHVGSGQMKEGQVPLILEKATCQGGGSSLTYARRYGILAFFGLAAEDDDGQRAEDEMLSRRDTAPHTASHPTPAAQKPVGPFDPNKPIVFGKFKGRVAATLTESESTSYANYLKSSAETEGKPLSGPAKAFVDWALDPAKGVF